jgi:hypothetical protein
VVGVAFTSPAHRLTGCVRVSVVGVAFHFTGSPAQSPDPLRASVSPWWVLPFTSPAHQIFSVPLCLCGGCCLYHVCLGHPSQRCPPCIWHTVISWKCLPAHSVLRGADCFYALSQFALPSQPRRRVRATAWAPICGDQVDLDFFSRWLPRDVTGYKLITHGTVSPLFSCWAGLSRAFSCVYAGSAGLTLLFSCGSLNFLIDRRRHGKGSWATAAHRLNHQIFSVTPCLRGGCTEPMLRLLDFDHAGIERGAAADVGQPL